MYRVSHVNELGVLEKSENFQTFRVCLVAQIMRIPVLKFSKITFWAILRLRKFFLFRRFTGFWVVSVSYKWHHQTRRKRFYRPYKNEPDWRWSILRKNEGKIISLTSISSFSQSGRTQRAHTLSMTSQNVDFVLESVVVVRFESLKYI